METLTKFMITSHPVLSAVSFEIYDTVAVLSVASTPLGPPRGSDVLSRLFFGTYSNILVIILHLSVYLIP